MAILKHLFNEIYFDFQLIHLDQLCYYHFDLKVEQSGNF